MEWKKTLIVGVVFTALLAFYLHDRGAVEKRTIASVKESRIIPFPMDDLTAIEFSNPSYTLRLERGEDRWWISQPERNRTNTDAVNSLLAMLRDSPRIAPFEVDPSTMGDYGLVNPPVTMKFEGEGQEPFELSIGNRTPDKTALYASPTGSSLVFTIAGEAMGKLQTAVGNIRDMRTLFADLTQASVIDLTTTDTTVRLERNTEGWQIAQPVAFPADGNFMREFLAEWNRQQILGFDSSTPEKITEYGLDHPWLTAAVTVVGDDSGTTETMRLMVGDGSPEGARGKPYYFARRDKGDVIIALDKQFVDTLLAASHTRFRDRHVFTMSPREIAVMRFTKIHGEPLAIERTEEGWVFTDGETGTVDQRAATEMLKKVVDLQAALIFDPDVEPEGAEFDRPIEVVEVMNKDRSVTQTMIIGRQPPEQLFSWAMVPERNLLVGLDWRDPGDFIVLKEDLEDRTLLTFDENTITRIELIAAGRTIVVEAGENGWEAQVKGVTQPVALEKELPGGLIFALRRMQWDKRLLPQYPADATKIDESGLRNPPQIVKLYDVEGKLVAEIAQGKTIEGDRHTYFTRDGEFFAVDKKRLYPVIDPINEIMSTLGQK